VKGVEVPLRTYLVDRVKPRAFRVPTRGIEGMQTRMVGRAAELEVLCASFDEAVFHRRAQSSTWSAKRVSARAGCSPNSRMR